MTYAADDWPKPPDAPVPTCSRCGSPLRENGMCERCDDPGWLLTAPINGLTMREIAAAAAEIDGEVA